MTKNKLAHSFTVVIPAKEFADKQTAKLEEIRKEAKIQGFRPGQAPMNIIKAKYENAVKGEVLDELIQSYTNKTFEDNKVRPALRPKVEIKTFEDGKDIEYTIDVEALPEIKPADFTKLNIEKLVAEASEKEVNNALEKLAAARKTTEVVDEKRATKTGDVIVIDFVGSIDGVEFKGGTGKDYYLDLGSNTFIPGFEEQLIGAEIGKETEINVTFPEEYQAKELAGKEAVFKCTVHEIKAKEIPELDDEFVSDVSEESETVDAYKAEVKAKIKERKEREGRQKKEDQAVEQAVANAQIDIPDPMIDLQTKQMADDFARRIMQQGMSLEQYFQFTGLSEEKMMEEFRPQAEKRIRTRLVLEAVVAAENIEVSDERLDEEL